MTFLLGCMLFCSCSRHAKPSAEQQQTEDQNTLTYYYHSIVSHNQFEPSNNSTAFVEFMKTNAFSPYEMDLHKNFEVIWVEGRLERWTNEDPKNFGHGHPMVFAKTRIDDQPAVWAVDLSGDIFPTNEPVNVDTNFLKFSFMQ
jgi:hypothetical protein